MKQTPKIRGKSQTHTRAAATPRPNHQHYRTLITRARAESDRTYKFITESSPSAILAYDLRGRLLYANPAVQDLTGYTVNDLWESNFINWFHPDDQTRMLSVWDNAFEGAKFVEEFRLIAKDNQVKWCSSVGGPLCDENGKQIGVLERARDISERKRAEQALFQNEQRYRLLFQHSPIGILHYDTDLQITDCNDRLRVILQTTRSRLIGLDMNTLRDQNVLPALRRALAGAEGLYEGFYRATTSAAEIWISMRTAPLFDEQLQVNGGIGIVEDISARHHTDEQIHAALREKEVLLKEIHHRVKNNLNVVCGLLNLQANLVSDALRDPLEASQKRIHAMALIHEKLYQSSDLARVNIAEYIGDLVDHLHVAYARANSPQVNLAVDDVRLDLDTAMACGMIVNELATNAFKHAFPSGFTPRAHAAPQEIRVALKHTDQRIAFTVSDNGIGLPPSLDWRHAQSLGLQLVQMFVEQLGGALELDTAAGTRWTIAFAMPRAE